MKTTNRILSGCGTLGALLWMLASCGGGGASGLRVEPSETRASETVLLIGEGLEEGDTVCFAPKGKGSGCGFPSVLEGLEPTGDKDGEMRARVTIPGLILPGDYEIRIGRGDDFSESADLTVLPRNGADKDGDAGEAPAPEGDGGEVITPDNPSGGTSPDVPDPTTPPTPAPVDEPFGLSLDGTQNLTETRLDLIRVQYKATGPVASLYLYAPLSPDGDCEGDLVIDPSGNDLNAGSANYFKYEPLLNGTACDEALGNCRGFTAQPAAPLHCRIDLAQNSGVFYTRLRHPNATYTLVAQSRDGGFLETAKTFTAAEPTLTPKIEISATKPLIMVRFDFAHAISDPSFTISGACLPDPAAPRIVTRYPNGSGTFQQGCRLTQKETAISMTVPGLGASTIQAVTVKLGYPETKLQKGAISSLPSEPGAINLYPSLERTYDVTDVATGNVLFTGSIPWAQEMKLYVRTSQSFMQEAKYEILRSVPANSAEALGTVFKDVVRDHTHSAWRLSVVDFDGQEHEGASVSAGYESELIDVKVQTGRKWYDPAGVFRLSGEFTARHAKSLEVRCNMLDGSGRKIGYLDESIPFSPDVYDSQTVKEEFVVRGEGAECFYVMIDFDGQWVPWNEGRAERYSK
ncbi:MAG TPA: hypothetical protein VLJ37_08475 [bacterium]|nr:hypothetical protein [bacterium]